MSKKKTDRKDEFSFEASFDDLQDIVAKLEDGNLTLGDSLKNYERGIKRLQDCYTALNQAEQKIRQLAEVDDDGNLVTSQFDAQATGSEKNEDPPGRRTNKKRRSKSSSDDDGLF